MIQSAKKPRIIQPLLVVFRWISVSTLIIFAVIISVNLFGWWQILIFSSVAIAAIFIWVTGSILVTALAEGMFDFSWLLLLPGLLAGFSARSLTDIAVQLAGRKRLALRDEWCAHLAGESGHDPAARAKVKLAFGFVAAAARLRLSDAADMAWRPADAVLGSRFLSNLFVWGPVAAVLVAIVHHDGRFGLVADVQDPVALGAFLYGAIRTGRWWRGVKPPEPKARRVKE